MQQHQPYVWICDKQEVLQKSPHVRVQLSLLQMTPQKCMIIINNNNNKYKNDSNSNNKNNYNNNDCDIDYDY